jgi:hypothetical protein
MDPMRRAAWWEEVEERCRSLAWFHDTDCEAEGFDEAACRTILREVRKKVPYPTMPEMAAYQSHKRQREREIDARVAPLKAALLGTIR